VLASCSSSESSIVADFAGGQVLRVDLFFEAADSRSDFLGFGAQFRPLHAKGFACLDEPDGLRGKVLLPQIKLGDLSLGAENVPLGGLGSAL
jgi:hypothetical protein